MGFVRRHFAVIRSVALFFGAVGVSFWALNNDWLARFVFGPFTSATAEVSAWIFRLAGQDAAVYGRTVNVNDTVVTVATGCNGAEAIGLYCAAVLAIPARLPRLVLGLGLGIVGLLLINQVRVIGLILVAILRPGMLFEAHNYVGQTLVIVMGMALWVFWVENYADIRHSQIA